MVAFLQFQFPSSEYFVVSNPLRQLKKILFSAVFVFIFGFTVCYGQNQASSETEEHDFLEQNSNDMKSFISLFEIPAENISRAIDFYQSILSIHIEKIEIPGLEMGIFPY
jgi:hypothetical protein